jgi:hypothetical protein
MTVTVSEVTSNQSFGVWLTRHNQMSALMTSNVVTADASNTGSVTTGNTYVNGYFVADRLIANSELRGGTANLAGPLFVSSNTFFQYSSANVLTITSNSSTSGFVSNVASASFGGNTLYSAALNTIVGGANLYVNATSTSFIRPVTANTITVSGAANLVTTLGVGGNANVGGDLRVAQNLYVVGNVQFYGVSAGDIVPTSNVYSLGNTTSRWTLYSMSGNFANGITVAGSNSSFNTNLLYLDTTNSRIGIGNSTPASVLTVAGTVEMTSGSLKFADGTTMSTANVARGSNTQIQFNDSTNVNGSIDFTYNKSTKIITANNMTVANLTVSTTANVAGLTTFGANVTLSDTVTSNVKTTGTIISNSIAYTQATSFTFSNTAAATVDSFPAASYRAEFLLSMNSGTNYHSSKILLLHDGSTSYITEYGSLLNNVSLGTISSTVNGGNVNLVVTPTVGNVAVKIVRNAVAI